MLPVRVRLGVLMAALAVGLLGGCLLGMATLANHVAEIVAGRSHPEVRRVDAKPIVAGMADTHPVWHVAASENERETVRWKITTLRADPELAVAEAVAGTSPNPTGVWPVELDDLGPETG